MTEKQIKRVVYINNYGQVCTMHGTVEVTKEGYVLQVFDSDSKIIIPECNKKLIENASNDTEREESEY